MRRARSARGRPRGGTRLDGRAGPLVEEVAAQDGVEQRLHAVALAHEQRLAELDGQLHLVLEARVLRREHLDGAALVRVEVAVEPLRCERSRVDEEGAEVRVRRRREDDDGVLHAQRVAREARRLPPEHL